MEEWEGYNWVISTKILISIVKFHFLIIPFCYQYPRIKSSVTVMKTIGR